MKTAKKNVHFLTLIECALFKSIHETNHDQVAILGRLHLQSAGIFCNTKYNCSTNLIVQKKNRQNIKIS